MAVCRIGSAVAVNGISFLRCVCPQFDKVYQSGVSAVVNTSGELPQKKEVYEEFLMEVRGVEWTGTPACNEV